MATEPRTHIDYTVGWVCALPKELIAAEAMLDETHQDLPRQRNDHNSYTLGRVGVHNVVVACLPKGEIGNNNAATVAARMTSTFPSIKFGLMVGIGGGVPKSVRLGDVVVSTPTDEFGGVVQWDFGKAQQEGFFKRTGALNRPPTELLSALTKIEKEHTMKGSKIPQYLKDLETNWPRLVPKYTRSNDDEEGYDDEGGENCIHCDQTKIIRRKPRDMRVHYGLIASGNQVIKDALFRDEINKKLGGKVLCFEMEAAGLMNDFPCLVIRGICDYADAHKNKNWQEHAAAVAAAFAKELLLLVPAQEVEQMPTIKHHQRHQEHQTIIDWLTPVNYATQQNDFIAQRQQGTGEWVLKSSEFRHWLEQTNQTLFCPGIPGAGKTIITSIVVHHLHDQFQNNPSQDEQRPVDLIINLLKQLVLGQSTIPEAVRGLYNRHKPKQTRPSLNEIRNTLHQVAALYSRTFLVLDALDECRAAPDGRDMLIREIFDFQANTKANLFATSRLIQEIEAKFQRAVRLEIRANDTDNCPSLISQNNSLQEEIEKKITRAVDGMFLLARLYVDSLACKTTAKAIKGALQELESTSEATSDEKRSKALDNAYEQAMQRIQGQVQEHQVLAKQVLSWISCAKRRLTSAELQHAIGVEENTSEFDRDNIADIGLIVSVCAGLVIVDKESDIIRLAHYTTQEYFERTWEHWFPNAHIDMTKVCTTYLSFEVFEEGYCLTKDALMERLQSHILYTHFGLWKPASILLDKNVNVESQDKGGQTPLSLAASKGHEAVVKLLLEKNANTECQTDGGWTPLLFAAWSGHEAVVKLLLEKNANIESQDDGGSTPLLLAAENGHEAVYKLQIT
ncbi:purine and uridine phosphorylase [Aspergillus pseudocaelatus]|uniref:Purine and uridine phosphorylase n=1 Tax=Aspergillus pseudocaelatus TaxID=1825620 RepID=A0ABQ6W8W8_9EURO|nr:purine and uridine phosphorylase [Aspergillus pseudocaelatus]